jgi:nucleoside-diphosphate-sugar epimerase
MCKKIIITGGLGHIGSSLLHDYRIADYDVTVIDSLHTHRYCSLFNLKHKVRFVEADIKDTRFNFVEVMQGADAVIHLAALVNAGATVDRDGETKAVNLDGAIRIAKAAEKASVKQIIHLSTTSVYGPNQENSCRSEDDDMNKHPQTPYAKYKLESENKVLNTKIPSRHVLRLGTLFGISPGIRFHTVTNKFVWQAITGQPISIWKPGKGLRPYASVEHVKDTMFGLLSRPEIESGIYNIVTEHWSPIQIKDAIERYIKDVKVTYVTPRILNQDSYIVHSEKAQKLELYKTSKDMALEQLERYIVEVSKYMLSGVINE